jgi:CXXC-20-CXXC protein
VEIDDTIWLLSYYSKGEWESMGLQKCGECKKKMKWSQIYKSLLLSYTIKCSHCGMEFRTNFLSRVLIGLLISLPILVILVPYAKKQSFTIPFTVTVGLVYSLLISLIFPYLVKYEPK